MSKQNIKELLRNNKAFKNSYEQSGRRNQRINRRNSENQKNDNWLGKINYMNSQWMPPLDKCAECQKSFSKGQEYFNLQKEGTTTMNFCVPCQNKYSLEKKNWQNECNHCKKEFKRGEENWELVNKETRAVLNTCLPCQDKHTFNKKQWE